MELVKLATALRPSQQRAEGLRTAASTANMDSSGVPCLQFGNRLVYLARQDQWAGFSKTAAKTGLALREHEGLVDRARLRLVIQKGGLFQREHPDVRVLAGQGRFLLVDMDPALAEQLAGQREPCFTVRSLDTLDAAGGAGSRRVVFEALGRGADQPSAPGAADPEVQALVDRISRATFEAELTRLVALPTRFSTSIHYRTACDIVEQRLRSLGYATSRQAISVNGSPSANVVARRPGIGPAGRGTIMVTAHLDSINHEHTPASPTSPAPGADDDGSGSAGVLEIARTLAGHEGFHDLVFVLFGGEEQGLFGSEHFVDSLSPSDRARVRAVVNMDMIGTLNVPTQTVLLEGRKISQPMIAKLSAAAFRYTTLAVETSLNAADSDHVSFLKKGVPAVLTIEGADSTNNEIHSARDTLDRINFDLALQILRMNTAFVATALQPD